jgi:hypothetical protein
MWKNNEDSGRSGARPSFTRGLRHARILAERNRGMLLDLVMLAANLFMMRYLTEYFVGIFRSTSDSDPQSNIPFVLCCVAMMTFPALGAVLKRWHYHQRLAATGNPGGARGMLWGCLCNPIFYFCLNIVIMSAIMSVGGMLLGASFGADDGGIFTAAIVLGTLLTGVQTFLVYRYFMAPKAPPRRAFLRDPRSEMVGDLLIFINMALFQAAWNIVMFMSLDPISDLFDFAGRLFFVSFLALLVYFPPRIFYLAEDINRPMAWLTMVLANVPVLLRVFGGG